MKRAVVAMSGGVDSSVAAFLAVRQGYDCIGATMKLFRREDLSSGGSGAADGSDAGGGRSCCMLEDAEDARSVAYALGIPFYVFNFTERFLHDVVDRFVDAYENGRTPNPCIDCNRYLKFDALFRRAREIGYDDIVTGHYARIERAGERFLLKKALDPDKDQSYVLYAMTQEQLAHTHLPLGGMKKAEVRALAREQGFVTARKRESQDICFVPDGDYAAFIERYTGKSYPEGDFVDRAGCVLGRHRGIIRYTVGQRRGLGLSLPEPLYVRGVSPADNTVTLAPERELYTKTLLASEINLIALPRIEGALRVKARVRYRQKEQWATATQPDGDTLRVEFDEPQRAVTRGQSVVLYDGETVVGGGTIREAF